MHLNSYQSIAWLRMPTSLCNAVNVQSLKLQVFQYFTLPGDESFELVKGGKNRSVDCTNVMQYIKVRFVVFSSEYAVKSIHSRR